jgi:hypothetical protein
VTRSSHAGADLATWLQAERVASVVVALPSGAEVSIPRFLRAEVRGPDRIERVPNCWAPNKPTIRFEGDETWAELVIVRLLEQERWGARWVKNWAGGREFCHAIGVPEPMPPLPSQMFDRIDRRVANHYGGGAWDVFAWRDDSYLFIESKQHRSSDKLRNGQIAWLEAGLAEGLSADSFAIVEYDAILAGPGSAPS